MNTWGKHSLKERSTSDPRLNKIGDVVLQIKNHSVVKGHRNKADQNAAFNAEPQRSKLSWPDGNHNSQPSRAVDVAPGDERATGSLEQGSTDAQRELV